MRDGKTMTTNRKNNDNNNKINNQESIWEWMPEVYHGLHVGFVPRIVNYEINNGSNLGQLPVNAQSAVDDDKFLNEGFAMLSSNT